MSHTFTYARRQLRTLATQLAYIPRTFAIIWAAAPAWTVTWAAMLLIQGLLPIATVYLTRTIVNEVVAAIRAGGTWDTMRPVLISGALLGTVMLISEAVHALSSWVRTTQSELAQDYITALIQRKSVEVDLAFYELPDFYDHLHRARLEATYRPAHLVESLGAVVQNGITFVAMAAILVPFGPIVPLALFLSTVPIVYVVLRSSLQRYSFAQRSTVTERQSWYYDELLTESPAAAEIRLFGLGDHLRNIYAGLRSTLRSERLQLARRQGLAELGAALLALCVTAAAMLWMVWRTVRGLITLGDLAMFYQAFNQGLGLARSLLENVGRLYENSLFLGNLFEFLALRPRIANPAVPVQATPRLPGLCFRDVTFRYPNSARAALSSFNLTIHAGQIVAIVGPNGAGKSTLVKLLCRFYDPDAGAIEIGGAPLASFAIGDLRRHISVLFQQPVHYDATASENIAFGDLLQNDPQRARAAAVEAGADVLIQHLPTGYATHLGKSFTDGTELSVGEWQRLAMARAFFRNAPILLLDEPTSAMDPWAEMEWAARLRAAVRDRIAIIVTHRFTTAMFADVIHVMRDGRIVESGSHEQLRAAGGLYAAGWAAQASIRTSGASAGTSEQAA